MSSVSQISSRCGENADVRTKSLNFPFNNAGYTIFEANFGAPVT